MFFQISKAIEEHEKAVKLQSRLNKMEEERKVFLKIVEERRKEKQAVSVALYLYIHLLTLSVHVHLHVNKSQ